MSFMRVRRIGTAYLQRKRSVTYSAIRANETKIARIAPSMICRLKLAETFLTPSLFAPWTLLGACS